MVARGAEEEAREEPFMGESPGPPGEVVLQAGGIFFRDDGEGRVPMEVLDRVAVLDEGEIIAFVRFHLLISKGAIGLSRLPSPAARVLQAAELLRAPGEGLNNSHVDERPNRIGAAGLVSD